MSPTVTSDISERATGICLSGKPSVALHISFQTTDREERKRGVYLSV